MRFRCIFCAVFFWVAPLHEALGDGPTCGEPLSIELASLTSLASPENPVGTVVTYTCQFGYVIDGTSRLSTCELTEDGNGAEWSVPRLACIPRSCGDPGFVSNGYRLGSLFTFSNSVSYQCNDGFRLIGGKGIRYCQASGSWSGRLPRCEAVSCDPPEDPENGRVSYNSLAFGSELKFQCNSGYRLDDTTPVYCTSNGTWSETNVTCVESACEIPQKPEYGSMEFIGTEDYPRAGTIAVFSCEGDRISSGPTSSKCLPNGQWTFPTPECRNPCSIPYVSKGKIGKWVLQKFSRNQKYEEIPVGTKLEDDVKLFLQCDHGYRPLGSTTNWQEMVICKRGKWSEVPFCELAICSSEPPETQNGKVEKMDRKHGGTVSYECLPDFRKVKSGNVKCNSGNWNGKPPICKDTRCYSEDLSRTGVEEIIQVTHSGDSLQVRCLEGYEPSPNLPQCSNGDWTRNQKSPCKERNCSVPWINNGYIEEQKLGPSQYNWRKFRWERQMTYVKVNIGSVPSREATLNIVCHDQYSLQGKGISTARIMCFKGKWSPDLACIRNGMAYTTTTAAPRFVNRNGFTERKSRTTSTPLTTLRTISDSSESRFVSRNGFIEIKSSTTTTSTLESAVVPEAVLEVDNGDPTDSEEFVDACSCEYLPDENENIIAYSDGKEVKMNERVKNGTVLNLRCEKAGYHRLLGSSEILCDCRPWSYIDYPTCVTPKRGDTIILYDNVSVALDGGLEVQKGMSLRLFCIAMETAKFPKWRFPNVTGINVSEERRHREGDVLYLSYLDIRNLSSKYDGPFACSVGRGYPTVVQLRVMDPNAHCIRFPLDEDVDIQYDDPDTHVGSKVRFSCQKNGQKLNGTSVATCLRSEEWSSRPPQCIDITCEQLKGTDLMTISYTDSQRIGSFANFHCFSPGQRNGVARTQCLENGKWKDPLPTCESPRCLSAALSSAIPETVEHDKNDVTDSSLPYNSTVKLLCRDEKNIVGSSFAKCGADGNWEVGDIECIRGCPPLEKAHRTNLVIEPEKGTYKFGEHVTLSCLDGYNLNVELEVAMCLQGGWSAALPECVESPSRNQEDSKTHDSQSK